MFWADRLVKKIIDSDHYYPYHVDDMKTPSGRVHVGALRGVVVHYLIHQALKDQGKEAVYTYVINDMDPMDGFPHYLPEKLRQHMGKPLFQVPSPEKGYASMAELYGQEFIDVFNKLGIKPEIIWSSQWYEQGRFNSAIKQALDKADQVRELYREISDYDKADDWHPFQVICPQCGKIGTTYVYGWDGQEVAFRCEKDLVDWAEGCGYQGKVSPFDGGGKLMWKVDWAAHWQVIGVTIEGAGKDHMTKGGSHDLSSAISKQVFDYPVPFTFLYEWFLAKGGSKMSSSRGIGVSAKEVSEMLPPELLRFLLIKAPYRTAIIFDPNDNQTILNLFDEYDRYARDYYREQNTDYGRIWQLSQLGSIAEQEPFLPRFREVVNYIQLPSVDVNEQFKKIKGSPLTKEEKEILKRRIKYARIWLENYAPKELVYQVRPELPEEAERLSDHQQKYLARVADLLKERDWQAEALQQQLYELAKQMKVSVKKAFQAIYLALLGKGHGPKAGWLILDNDLDLVVDRFRAVQELEEKARREKEAYLFKTLDRPELFSIDKQFKERFPSVVVGIAVIKGVKVKRTDSQLQQEVVDFIQRHRSLTVSQISQFPELQSYRRLYKETGVDWHSRRPSPEALLRRVAQGKELSSINSCVDAYNLVVMKNRVSCGAFDLDRLEFPTVLRLAEKGEQITLLGDKEPTEYRAGEAAYFDQQGGYNIDFNYLDAERTKVDLETKNLWVNTEGVYQISREQVEKTLKEVIDKLTKYCGGQVELAGIIE